jgi:hypothetical protein
MAITGPEHQSATTALTFYAFDTEIRLIYLDDFQEKLDLEEGELDHELFISRKDIKD